MSHRSIWPTAFLLLVLHSPASAVASGQIALRPGTAPIGHPAPDFTRTGFQGQRISLHALRGHVVLLNFWASWCGPCLAEMPVFSVWQQQQGLRGLQIVGVSMDDDAASAQGALGRIQVRYPVFQGDAALARSYGGVLGLPVSFLIDRDGIVRRRYDGAVDLGTVQQDLLALLAKHPH